MVALCQGSSHRMDASGYRSHASCSTAGEEAKPGLSDCAECKWYPIPDVAGHLRALP